MHTLKILRHGALGGALAAALAMGATPLAAATLASAPASAPHNVMTLSVGKGQLVRLPATMSDLFVADPTIADVQVRSASALYVFGKGQGETTVYATAKGGGVVWSASVRVGANLDNIGNMLKIAMPDAAITATTMSGIVILTGTVAGPDDVEEAGRLVQAFVGKDVQVVSRLKSAVPLQVSLHVKIVEVNRSFVKSVGVNLLTRDTSGGFLFGIGRGSPGTISTLPGDVTNSTTVDTNGAVPGNTLFGQSLLKAGTTALGFAGHAFGLDLLSTIDLAETDGFLTTLAEPNLTALSGETASFLAGGEIPIPVAQQLGQISIEYKQYGVSLAFTPTVLGDGRISMRVRPEVSELSDAGAVTLNGYSIPALTTRRAETTVELGSGQSFMIGGLLSNSHSNSTDKAPFLGDLPVIGALFRSNAFKRNETELVIVVTPYLVKPVSASQIALPSDGYKAATDAQRILGGQDFDGRSGAQRPMPRMEAPVAVPPVTGAIDPQASPATDPKRARRRKVASATPGFSFN